MEAPVKLPHTSPDPVTTATVLYVFSGGTLSMLPQIEVQSGTGQTGAPEGQLDDYFEVRVTDGRRRAISGLPVTFTKADPTGATAMELCSSPFPARRYTLLPPDSTSIDAVAPTTVEATTTNPPPAETRSVQTDRNGVAKIYYQLSEYLRLLTQLLRLPTALVLIPTLYAQH